VWFCNRRQKEKRMLSGALNAAAAAGGLLLSAGGPGSVASSTDPRDDVLSPGPSRSTSGDESTADEPPYPPPGVAAAAGIDYCNALPPRLRADYCSPVVDSVVAGFQSAPPPPPPPEVQPGLSSYACAVSGWPPSHFRSPQFASLMVAAATGAILPDTHSVSSLAM